MRTCSLRMTRLDTNDPHHRITISRKLFGPETNCDHVIMEFLVGNEVTEHRDSAHTPTVDEAADIQEARVFAHQLAAMEVSPWKT